MNDSAKIKYFPKYSVKAYDGMSVTADVWETAHNEHRDALRAHYEKQLNVYALALERITGMKVKQRLLCLLHSGETIQV